MPLVGSPTSSQVVAIYRILDRGFLQWSIPVLPPVVTVTTVVHRPWHHIDVTAISYYSEIAALTS